MLPVVTTKKGWQIAARTADIELQLTERVDPAETIFAPDTEVVRGRYFSCCTWWR